MQRKTEKLGVRLGKTTGWINRLSLKHKQVHCLSGVEYHSITADGINITQDGKQKTILVDTIIICTGQLEQRDLYIDLKSAGRSAHIIGGAYKAHELDARYAIDQAYRLAALL